MGKFNELVTTVKYTWSTFPKSHKFQFLAVLALALVLPVTMVAVFGKQLLGSRAAYNQLAVTPPVPTSTPKGTPKPICGNTAPQVFINPAVQSAKSGTALTYTVVIRNNEPSYCPVMKATIYPDAMVSGWTVNFSQVNIDILPQGTKSYDFKITSPVGVKPGDYQIGVYVRASTMASLARATYRVTVPKPTSPIGTPVRDY